MSPDHLFAYSKQNILIDEQALPSEAKCLTLEAGNKIFVKHQEPSDEADHLTLPNDLPILYEAQLALTSLKSLEAVDLRDDLANPRHIHVNTTLSIDERTKMIDLL
ncbi:hypothetical protein SLE2022_376580 [Rubroshorea leprosula]